MRGEPPETLAPGRYVTSSHFGQALMAWRATRIRRSGSSPGSEFLAVGSMAVLAIYLRQRASPESKPVGAPHVATGAEG